MRQQRRYKEPQDTLWGKFLSGFMAVVFAMSTLTLIPIASAINGEPNEAQIQQQEELADQTSGKDEKAAEPAADEQKLEPVELLSIASVEDEDDADDAAPADATLKVKAQNATVTYNGNDVATELVVPAGKDVKFTVKAADGFMLGAAAVKLADAKGETTLTPNAGEYTVAADRVADGATVVVTAEAVVGSANTDAAEPSTPAPSTELGEKTANAESIITSIMSFFGGTSMLDARGWDNGNGNAGINPAEVGSYPVYVYTQIHLSSGVTGNSTLNKQATDLIKGLGVALNGNASDNKWYTLGTISNAMTSPGNATGRLGSDADKNRVIENLNSLNRYGNNTFPLDKVSGWGLHTSEAADGYSGSQVIGSSGQSADGRNITVTWHLDGTATIVKYTWKDGDKVLDTRVGFTGAYTEDSEVNKPEAPNGYEFDGWEQDTEGEDVVFNAKWKKNSFAYTVEYYVDGDRIEAQEGWSTGGEAEYGTTASVTPAATATIDEANYMLESTNHSVTIDADTSKNVIKVVYTKDSIGTTDPTQPDGVADKYQATIKYAAGANGSVTGTTTRVVTLMDGDTYVTEATITPGTEGVTVTPATGYEFDRWTDSDPATQITAKGGQTYTYTASFAKGTYAYTVNYYKDSIDPANEIDAQEGWPTGAAAEYQSEVTISPEQRVTIEGKNYILDSADHKIASISATESDNVISVVYAVDEVVDPAVDPNPNEPGDGVPDYRQAVINYVSADDAQGRVAPDQKVVTLEADEMPSVQMIVLDGVTATPETGYVLAGWTAEDGTTVAPREMRDIAGGQTYTYTASFAKGTYAYTVNYYKDSIDPANEIDAQEGWPTGAAAEYQSEVTISPEQRVTIEGKNYILDSADHKIASISATESDNVISVVYAVDEVVDPAVDPNPNEPGDGVPDYRQAVINYVSADDAQGRVAPDQKVVTLEADEMPSVQMIVLDGVTATPETGYVLAGWTAEDGTTVAPREMRDIAGGQTYTYTASFKGDFTAISATPYEGVFDGAYHTPTVNGTIEGDTVSFSADHRNVTNGPATVTIKVTRGAETYTIDSTVTITPRPVVVTANDASKIYGEADPTLTAAVRGIEGNTASGLVGNDTVAYTVSRATGEDAGEYDITATGDAVQGNYAVTYMPATFTITAAGGNVVTADNIAGVDGLTKMYDGQVASVEAEAARSGSTLLYSTDGVSFTTQNPVFINAGSYDVYVMATNPNYEDTPVVRTTVTITPAPVTVTVGNAAKTAGAVDPTFAATVTGLVNGESAGLISYALTRTAGEDAGSYVITAAGDRVQGNYIVTYVPGTLVITAALVPPAALPAGPAAPAAVAALDTILDDGVPLATIDDDENALAAFEEIHCWTHWLMIFGALVTIVYGLAVLYRRRHGIRDMDDFEGDIMGGRKYDAAAEKNPATGNAFQAM